MLRVLRVGARARICPGRPAQGSRDAHLAGGDALLDRGPAHRHRRGRWRDRPHPAAGARPGALLGWRRQEDSRGRVAGQSLPARRGSPPGRCNHRPGPAGSRPSDQRQRYRDHLGHLVHGGKTPLGANARQRDSLRGHRRHGCIARPRGWTEAGRRRRRKRVLRPRRALGRATPPARRLWRRGGDGRRVRCPARRSPVRPRGAPGHARLASHPSSAVHVGGRCDRLLAGPPQRCDVPPAHLLELSRHADPGAGHRPLRRAGLGRLRPGGRLGRSRQAHREDPVHRPALHPGPSRAGLHPLPAAAGKRKGRLRAGLQRHAHLTAAPARAAGAEAAGDHSLSAERRPGWALHAVTDLRRAARRSARIAWSSGLPGCTRRARGAPRRRGCPRRHDSGPDLGDRADAGALGPRPVVHRSAAAGGDHRDAHRAHSRGAVDYDARLDDAQVQAKLAGRNP